MMIEANTVHSHFFLHACNVHSVYGHQKSIVFSSLLEYLFRSHEAGGAVAPPIFFNAEFCHISSAHKKILEILDDHSGCCKLLQTIFDLIVLIFLDREI